VEELEGVFETELRERAEHRVELGCLKPSKEKNIPCARS